MCWFKSNSKKERGIFFSSRRQAEPGADPRSGPFLIFAGDARVLSRHLFQSIFVVERLDTQTRS